jgi:hypothetical protein
VDLRGSATVMHDLNRATLVKFTIVSCAGGTPAAFLQASGDATARQLHYAAFAIGGR